MAVWSVVKTSLLGKSRRLDAEYYQPKFLDVERRLNELACSKLGTLLRDCRYGLYVEPDYLPEGEEFLRALNMKEVGIEGEILKIKPTLVPNEKYRCKEGDILIVRSGANVGDLGIITPRFAGATFGSYVIKFQLRERNPFFLYAFLKSKFGRLQTLRLRTGLAQPNINIPNLKEILVPREPAVQVRETVEGLIRSSRKSLEDSEALYLEAEQMLLKEVQFDKVDLSWTPGYVVNAINAREVSRIDAEHFQPKYARLIRHLEKTGKAVRLGDILKSRIEKGVTPEYTDAGVPAVNSQHLGRYLLNFEGVDHTTESYWAAHKRAQIKHLDVLVYATGAYIGRANCFLEKVKALAGVDILMVRPGKDCNAIYLSVFLNSPLGLLQAEKWASGSAQRHLYPEDVASFTLFLPAVPLQQKIADLVTAAYEARAKAKKLLEDAKRKVEELIEKS